jgi:L-amino acid N-acyltransferase YncA
MPGVSALFTRPYEALAGDYGRGMFSVRYADQERCVSNFPHIYYDVLARAGSCQVLIGRTAHRVLGLASITPIDAGARRHVGQLEVMTHENLHAHGPALLQATAKAGRARGMQRAVAYVPTMDTAKRQWLRDAGATKVGVLHGQVQLKDQSVDVEVFECELAGIIT